MFSENRDWEEGIEFFKRNRINNFEESMNSRVGSQSLRGHSLAVVGVGAAAWHPQWWMVPAGAGEVKLKQSQVQLHWTWGAPISAAQLHIVMKNGKPNIPQRPASEQHRYGWKILLISNSRPARSGTSWTRIRSWWSSSWSGASSHSSASSTATSASRSSSPARSCLTHA